MWCSSVDWTKPRISRIKASRIDTPRFAQAALKAALVVAGMPWVKRVALW